MRMKGSYEKMNMRAGGTTRTLRPDLISPKSLKDLGSGGEVWRAAIRLFPYDSSAQADFVELIHYLYLFLR